MAKHFKDLYAEPFDATVYSGSTAEEVQSFATSTSVQIMVMSIHALRGDKNSRVIHQTRDKLNGILYDALNLYRKGEYVRGRAILGTVGSLAETNDDRFKVSHLMGNFFYREKRFEEALEQWKDALSYNPENVQIQRNVEILEKQLGTEQ